MDQTLGHTYVNYVMMGAFLIAHLYFPFLLRSASLQIQRHLSLATPPDTVALVTNRSNHGNKISDLATPDVDTREGKVRGAFNQMDTKLAGESHPRWSFTSFGIPQ